MSAAFDPQACVQRYQSYEGIMPIFHLDLLPVQEEEDLRLAQEEDLLIAQEEDPLLVQKEDLRLVQEEYRGIFAAANAAATTRLSDGNEKVFKNSAPEK